jgi:hypothetical protein
VMPTGMAILQFSADQSSDYAGPRPGECAWGLATGTDGRSRRVWYEPLVAQADEALRRTVAAGEHRRKDLALCEQATDPLT